ncbi:HDOD domain-containing protein [Desulfoluna spongiiphila]|uniref:HDIG domain-containing protein/MJ0042 family finger-like domain-containing protein n=1 Tax=Desulfoluna spongiiphila TaxID=419481 RepID=A0A1G5ER33_9BACT|nr:HDOD domain-containing protein [Desulfoluna spongiiphila]SCY29426.1 HDIG domain-containing protein/MJ0042 family finger-like domain-containing protein [Desulfoluna spongiiphila]VVS91287.1 metal-dependent hydrolase hdod [Desulfoluna spongiiphila]
MKIQCPACAKAYRIKDEIVHKVHNKTAKCTQCGQLIPIAHFILDKEALAPFATGEALRQEVVGNLKKLYPMPHILLKARKLLAGDGNFDELGSLLNTDPALASRVLKVANSAYYGMSGKVSSLHMAATVLGSGTLMQILLLVGNAKALGQSLNGYGLGSGELWRHSLAVAVCSGLIEKKLHASDGEEAFFAGLMHDSGKIILDSYVLERKPLFTRYEALTREPLYAVEKKILGLTHGDIGFELCRKWNLPDHMATAIRDHHTPGASGGNKLAYVIQLANHMADRALGSTAKTPPLPSDALTCLHMTATEVEGLITEALTAVETMEEDTY